MFYKEKTDNVFYICMSLIIVAIKYTYHKKEKRYKEKNISNIIEIKKERKMRDKNVSGRWDSNRH